MQEWQINLAPQSAVNLRYRWKCRLISSENLVQHWLKFWLNYIRAIFALFISLTGNQAMHAYLRYIWKSPFSVQVSGSSILGTDNLVTPYSLHKSWQDREIKVGVRGVCNSCENSHGWLIWFLHFLSRTLKPHLTPKQHYLMNSIMNSVWKIVFFLHALGWFWSGYIKLDLTIHPWLLQLYLF